MVESSTVSRRRKSKRESLLNWLETQALTALHAFPLLYCRPSPVQPGTPSALLHAAYREEILARLSSMSFVKRTVVVFAWPPAMVLWGLGLTFVNGAFVARRFGRSMIDQFADQMRLAFKDGIPVSFFYTYELHDPLNRVHAHEYVLRGHIKGGGQLYKRLYRDCPERREGAKILNDKLAFHQFCVARNLPTARLFAVVTNESFSWTETSPSALPPTDLFFKPQKESGGSGAERWVYVEGRYHRHGSDNVLDVRELSDRLARLSRRQPYLVYECLANHRDIQDLSAGALSTLRIHTMLNEQQEVEHLFTMLRMSQFRQRIVDTRDGIAATVDPITGLLGRGSNSSLLARWVDHHPFTGAGITGRPVPFWHDALDLAITTHAQLASPYIVGWDIAITERGPVIVEANKSPDVEIEQRLNGPWGNGRFGALMMHYLTRAAGSETMPASHRQNAASSGRTEAAGENPDSPMPQVQPAEYRESPATAIAQTTP